MSSIVIDYYLNRGKKDFKEGHAFIGYQKDTPAAVIFQASKRIKDLRKRGCWRLPSLKKSGFLKDISAKVFASEKKGSDLWKYAVSNGDANRYR